MFNKIKSSIVRFIQIESSSSILLVLSTIAALFLANSIFSTIYQEILNYKFLNLSISYWVNDGLMAIFFFVVGLEIKKEMMVGELNTLKKASFPLAAALGGMIVPALIYLYFNRVPPEINGWGIPMATDIAFALGVLSLFGKRIPVALKILLLAIAIVDDLGTILVIAFFYTAELKYQGLFFAGGIIVAIQIFKHFKISNFFIYLMLGISLWLGVLYSGIHATIAGVILGLLTPISFKTIKGKTLFPLEKFLNKLHTPVSFIIMPLFALTNAGVEINLSSFSSEISSNLFLGIFFGLIIGKPFGIILFSYVSFLLRISKLPKDLNWKHIFIIGCIAGIGFTMSLFISKLALSTDLESVAKLAILLGSLGSMLAGVFAILLLTKKNSSGF